MKRLSCACPAWKDDPLIVIRGLGLYQRPLGLQIPEPKLELKRRTKNSD